MAETVSASTLRELFDGVTDHTVGVEEELMLLDPGTLDLLPAAARVHAELGGRVALRGELPAAQVETASPVCDSIDEAAVAIAAARRELGTGVSGWARLAGAGTHPFAAPLGPLREDSKYDALKAAFPWALPQQLVFGLHVHVAVRGADRALAVLNALRSYLPDLAALAGNAPLHAGRDTGLASVRPEISSLLPRQGVPPAFSSWAAYSDYLAWGRRGGLFPAEGEPWWEARAHDELGTIELRVPDAQTTAGEAAGVLALGAGLVAWLAARYDAGEPLPVHDTIRIAENRWRALRHGLTGALLDLDSGEQQPARARVLALIDRVAPAAERLGGAAALEHARTLAARNGAERQRAIATEHGPRAVVEALADAFLP
ncbi:MAG: YbdK family carboxylate-amine ligase [Solirubrobacteraceae bacterium]